MNQQNPQKQQSLKEVKNQKDKENQRIRAEKEEKRQRLLAQNYEELPCINEQLDHPIQLKEEHASNRPSAPNPLVPLWQQPGWKYSRSDERAMAYIASRLNLDADIFVATEAAQFLRQMYIKEQPTDLTEHAQQFLERLEVKKGSFSNSGYVELLLGCCLGITHTRDGAVNLISKCQMNGKNIRGKDTLHAHYKRMMENGLIPEVFLQCDPNNSPPADVLQFRNKRVCSTPEPSKSATNTRQPDVEPVEIRETPSCSSSSVSVQQAKSNFTFPQSIQASPDSSWLQERFTLSEKKVAAVIEFAKKMQLTEQEAREAMQTAEYIRRAKAGNLSIQDSDVSRFLSRILDLEGNCNVGSLTLLLLIACLAFTGNPSSASHLLGDFQFLGKEFRNWESLRKALIRKKSLIPSILMTDS